MKGFEEIAVIHGINDYDEARFLEGFLKWIGVSFFDYVYNDLYDEFNQHLENSGERFDAVIYINDENDKYISRFGCLSETNIRLSFMLSDNTGVNAGIDEESFENIWKIIIDAIYSNNTNQELYADSEIKPISVNIRKDNAFAKNDKDGCIQIFEELAEIYAENNLFKEIGDGKIYLMNECEMKQDGQMAIEARIKLWETVLDELDKVSINKDNVCFDNFCYAKIYCKKEIHILRCVTEKWVYTDEMRRKFQEIELDIENLPKDGVKYSNMSLGLIFDIYAMNPEVVYYCEQPCSTTVFVSGKEHKTIFDVYIVYKNGREEFQEVKYQQELDSDSPKGKRSQEQIEIQKMWCLQNDFPYVLRTDKDIEKGQYFIRNLSVLSAKARRFHIESKEADKAIISYLSKIERTTIGLLSESGRFEINKTLDYLSDLYYRGIIKFDDICNDCLTNKTEVIFCGI